MTEEGVSQSRFFMWRAIFSMAHADQKVAEEEREFMLKALKEQPFSQDQRRILEQDIAQPQDIAEMFAGIENQDDRSRFFYFARMLMWCDGDFNRQEQRILTELERAQLKSANFSTIDTSAIHLDDEWKEWLDDDMRKSKGHVWDNFLRRFGS